MLKPHFDAVEQALLHTSQVTENSGHRLHKGTPREAFVRGFLNDHLGEQVKIGSGEVIDAASKAGEDRNQLDLVLFRRDYPKLYFGGGISCFLAESVVATLEVKSALDEKEFNHAVAAAHNLKKLSRHLVNADGGWVPPAIVTYIVAFRGPASIQTALGWLPDAHAKLKTGYPALGTTLADRVRVASPSIDGIFILGTGFAKFDNVPASFTDDAHRAAHPKDRWEFADTKLGTLFELFLLLNTVTTAYSRTFLNAAPYLAGLQLPIARSEG